MTPKSNEATTSLGWISTRDRLRAEVKRLKAERDEAIEAMKCEGLLPVPAPCSRCGELWPHPGVLSTNPVCQSCRRKAEAQRDAAVNALHLCSHALDMIGSPVPEPHPPPCGEGMCGWCYMEDGGIDRVTIAERVEQAKRVLASLSTVTEEDWAGHQEERARNAGKTVEQMGEKHGLDATKEE